MKASLKKQFKLLKKKIADDFWSEENAEEACWGCEDEEDRKSIKAGCAKVHKEVMKAKNIEDLINAMDGFECRDAMDTIVECALELIK